MPRTLPAADTASDSRFLAASVRSTISSPTALRPLEISAMVHATSARRSRTAAAVRPQEDRDPPSIVLTSNKSTFRFQIEQSHLSTYGRASGRSSPWAGRCGAEERGRGWNRGRTSDRMRVCVASKNPVKCNAAKAAISECFKTHTSIEVTFAFLRAQGVPVALPQRFLDVSGDPVSTSKLKAANSGGGLYRSLVRACRAELQTSP
jgi:hypothetical protein